MSAEAATLSISALAHDGGVRVTAPRVRAVDLADIEAAQGGDRQAFDRLVERYQRDVYRLCYRYVNNHHDASDLAQESFLKAYRAIGRFRGERAFSTWLYRIAVNTCLTFRAARKLPSGVLPDDLADTARAVTER